MLTRIKKVLVVDDSPDFRMLFGEILRPFPLEILFAENGLQAAELLKAQSIDLLITNFRMPLLDGVELLRWCRSQGFHHPVIFTTAASKLFKKEEIALGDCCATLLRKPFSMELLREALVAADARVHHIGCVHTLGTDKRKNPEAKLQGPIFL